MVEYIAGEVMKHPTCETCKWKETCQQKVVMDSFYIEAYGGQEFEACETKPISYCSNHKEAS